jgi:hypothetical protein
VIESIAPTTRAMPWSAVAVSGIVALGIAAVVRASGSEAPTAAAALAAGTIAAAAALCREDPAGALLAAVPTSPRRRLALRAALVTPVCILIWCSSCALAGYPEFGVRPLLALIAAGFAGGAVVACHRPDAAAGGGAVFALAWAAAPLLPILGPLDQVATVWLRSPVTVLVVSALIAGIVERDRHSGQRCASRISRRCVQAPGSSGGNPRNSPALIRRR